MLITEPLSSAGSLPVKEFVLPVFCFFMFCRVEADDVDYFFPTALFYTVPSLGLRFDASLGALSTPEIVILLAVDLLCDLICELSLFELLDGGIAVPLEFFYFFFLTTLTTLPEF